MYLENLLQPHLVAVIEKRGALNYRPLAPSRRLSWTALEDQAKFAVAALTAERAAGRAFNIASPEPVTGDELVRLLSEAAGKAVKFEPLTPRQFGASLAQVYGADAGAGIAALHEATDALPADGATVNLTEALEILPVELIPVSDWIRANFGGEKDINA